MATGCGQQGGGDPTGQRPSLCSAGYSWALEPMFLGPTPLSQFSPRQNGGDGHPVPQAAAGEVLGVRFSNWSLLLLLRFTLHGPGLLVLPCWAPAPPSVK